MAIAVSYVVLDCYVQDVHNESKHAAWARGSGNGSWDLAATMFEFLETSQAQLVLWLLCGAVLVAVGVYVVKRFRDRSAGDHPGASEVMSKFREIHSRGGLSDEEFRTIKAQLAAQLSRELEERKTKEAE
jgi:uncharacterized membrane protein